MILLNTTETLVPFQSERGSKIKHYAAVHHKGYTMQPKGFEMGRITNDIKRQAHAQLYTASELLEAFSSGQNILLSNFELDSQNNIRFISSSAFAVDVDDNFKATDPLDVLESLGNICTGLFYTFSHGIKGNRYRLLFQLDKPITVSEDMEDLIEYMVFYLKEKGLPVDGGAKSPTQIIRGGKLGYEINNFETVLNVSEWLDKAKAYNADKRAAIKARQDAAAQSMSENLKNPVTFEELLEMCTVIGHIPSGSGDEVTHKWLQVVYALKDYVQMGFIDNEQGYELFHIVSGGESNERYWNSIKPNGFVTIGTIIHHASQVGYKRKHKYGYALQESPEVIPVERIGVDKHIPTEVAAELLGQHERVIVDAPTGSGKTTAFMNAFKRLANKEYNFYIFVAPTIVLSEQIALEHNVTCAKGGIKGFKNMIVQKVIQGERVFVSTYDKAAEVVSFIESGIKYENNPKPKFYLVYDEVHKLTEAYNYRFSTIDKLNELASVATSLIGLSGTPEDLLKNNWDKLIKIDNGNSKSTNLDYRIFTYDTNEKGVITPENADLMLVPVVRGLLQQTRVLLFINNKDRIQRVARLLKGEGINVQTVTSDKRQSATYTNIVENGAIDDDVQVVISTSVLADGISLNNDLNWSCVVVADRDSQMWNSSTIKQISHRFRNQYRYFALYMRTPNPDYAEERRFNIESEYQNRLRIVNNHVNYLNNEFQSEALQDFIPSNVEKYHGIFYKATEEAAEIEFNPLFVRHQSMKAKENYYAAYRMAFIKEVGRMIGHKLTGVFNVNEEVRKNGSDLSGLLVEIETEKEEKKQESLQLREDFDKYFTEEIYENIIHRIDEEALSEFKKTVHPDQYSAALKNAPLTDFETCKRLGKAITRRAEINKYSNDVRALTDIASFEHVRKMTVTKKVFNALSKLVGETYLVADFKEIIEVRIPKKLKVSKKEVNEAMKLFHRFNKKSNGERLTEISPLNIELVANVRHEIDEEVVRKSILKFIATRPQQQQKVLLKSVEKLGLKQR